MINIRKAAIIAIVAAFAIAIPTALFAADTPPAAYLPGLLQPDQTPHACVSCHAKHGDKDYTLPAELKNIKGHPDISKIVKVAPTDCLKCHTGKGKIPALGNVVHKIHFGPTADKTATNHFVTAYSGACMNCHALDLTTGEMSVKSGPANW